MRNDDCCGGGEDDGGLQSSSVSLGCQLKEYALVSDSCSERAGKIRKREARPDAFFCYGRRDPVEVCLAA